MTKIINKTLDNGLKVIIVENKEKHRSDALISIKAGGHSTFYIKDGIKHNLKNGLAHFLEHYLIEKGRETNLGEYFSLESIDFNGITYDNKTEFYISTVHDFKKNLSILLKMINKPIFSKELIEDVKKPIIEEIKRANDNKLRKEYREKTKALYKNLPGDITLGIEEDIKNVTIEELEEFHNTFYTPDKELITIYTNNNSESILKLIEKEYKNIKNNNIEEVFIKEPLEVKQKELTIVNKENDPFIQLVFKVDISKYDPFTRLKLDGYLMYFFKHNFGDESKLFKELIDKKLSLYSINYKTHFTSKQDYLELEITIYTENYSKSKELILNTIDNLEYDEHSFKIWKNNLLIDYITVCDNNFFENRTMLTNYYAYNIDYLEDIEDIKSLNLEEGIKLINNLEFNNYLTIKRVKE